MTETSSLLEHSEFIWLALGVVCVLLEAFSIPGIGFLFLGFASISVGGLILGNVIEATDLGQQILWLGIFTVAWAALLWIPMKRFRMNKQAGSFNNIIGNTASVAQAPLVKGREGTIRWSGTIVKAQLAEDAAVDQLEVDASVVITDIQQSIFIVTPK